MAQDGPSRHRGGPTQWVFPQATSALAELEQLPITVEGNMEGMVFGINGGHDLAMYAADRLRARGLDVFTKRDEEFKRRSREAGGSFEVRVSLGAVMTGAGNVTTGMTLSWSVLQDGLRLPQLEDTAVGAVELYETKQQLAVVETRDAKAQYERMMEEAWLELRRSMDRAAGSEPERNPDWEPDVSWPARGNDDSARPVLDPSDSQSDAPSPREGEVLADEPMGPPLDFNLTAVDGQRYALADVSEPVVLVAVSMDPAVCRPCAVLFRNLDALPSEYDGLVAPFGVVIHRGGRPVSGIDASKYELPIFADAQVLLSDMGDFEAFPTLAILGPDRRVVRLIEGLPSKKVLLEAIEGALSQ